MILENLAVRHFDMVYHISLRQADRPNWDTRVVPSNDGLFGRGETPNNSSIGQKYRGIAGCHHCVRVGELDTLATHQGLRDSFN